MSNGIVDRLRSDGLLAGALGFLLRESVPKQTQPGGISWITF